MKPNNPTRIQVKKLVEDPLSYALLMEDQEIEETVVQLMEALRYRKKKAGGD